MSLPVKLKLHQKIAVTKPGDKDVYLSVIEDIKENREISIAIPLSQTSSLPVKAGEKLSIKLLNEVNNVEFSTTVKELRIEGVPLYVLSFPEEATRVQLREHVRIDLLMEILYKKMKNDKDIDDYFDEDDNEGYQKGTALNISAGGMKVTVPEQFFPNELVALKIKLPVKETVYKMLLKARVIRAVPIESKKKSQPVLNQLGLSFLNTTNLQKDNIMQFIFNKTAELRRSGKV